MLSLHRDEPLLACHKCRPEPTKLGTTLARAPQWLSCRLGFRRLVQLLLQPDSCRAEVIHAQIYFWEITHHICRGLGKNPGPQEALVK